MQVKNSGLMRFFAVLPMLGLFAQETPALPKKPVLAFYAEWDAPGNIDYSKITHLLFAFSLPQGGGGVTGYVPGGIVSAAHAAGVKCMASVGGVNNSAEFPSIAANSGSRTTFANALKSLCSSNNLDGVDIDWEFPANAADSANFTLLLKQLRTTLGTKLISVDVAPDDEKGKWVSKSAALIPDFFNVMAYDYTGDFKPDMPGQHAPYGKATTAMNYWRLKGVPRPGIIMGVPFYGKDFNQGGTAVPYKTIMGNNPGLSVDADSVGRCWYNGVTTMKAKATYVANYDYGGIMIWELAEDVASGPKSLLDAIQVGLQAPSAIRIVDGRVRASAAEALGLKDAEWRDALGRIQGNSHVTQARANPSGAYFTADKAVR